METRRSHPELLSEVVRFTLPRSRAPRLSLPPVPSLPPPSPSVNEDVRIALLSCMALYLPGCTAAPDAATLALLGSGTRDPKELTRRACLRAVGAAMLAAPKKR